MKRWAILLQIAALALPVVAQVEDDQPGKGVARLALVDGDVGVRRGDSGDTIAAALNAPLAIGDRVVSGPNSRAEVQFDWGNMIRIGANADVRLAEIDGNRVVLQVGMGTTTFRVLRRSPLEIEVSTPSFAVHPLGEGAYRVAVYGDGTSEVSVRTGEAEIATPRGTERLRAGMALRARGTEHDPEFQDITASARDGWDQWNDERDAALERAANVYDYVPQGTFGAEDLDGHGQWVQDDSYGQVWVPQVAEDWAPYQQGRWVWLDYYGWTWVSYDPWGWAPYHYGRWYHSPRFGWCWWPGMHSDAVFWRPALVAFFGWGRGTYGFGTVGWIPLAPHEPFHPWYGRGFYGGHSGGLNTIVAGANVGTIYRNAGQGATAVPGEVFGRRAITHSDRMRIDPSQMQSAGLVRGVLPVTPGRESQRMVDRTVSFRASSRETTFFTPRGTAGPSRTVRFDQQRQAVDRVTQQSFGSGSGRGTVSSGWRRVGESPVYAPARPVPAETHPAVQSAPAERPSYSAPRAYPRANDRDIYTPQPVRINPPIVRERPASSAPQPSAPSRVSGGSAPTRAPSGGGGGASAPRSAPAPSGGGNSGGGNSNSGHGRGR